MHRHQYKGRKLSRKTAQRKALMRNLASQIILHEKIETTLPKAKEVRPILERLITKAKVDSVANRRHVAKYLSNRDKSLGKLFVELGPLYKNRQGGYLRIVRLGNREGDNAEMAQIQLIDTDKLTKKEIKKKSSQEKTGKSKDSVFKKKNRGKVTPEKRGTKTKKETSTSRKVSGNKNR